MTTKLFDGFDSPEPADDPDLDQLLSEARWPEPDGDTLARLQSMVSSVLASSIDVQETRIAAPVPTSGDRWTQMQRLALAAAVAAALLVAFLAGRWTSSDGREPLAGTQPTDQPAGVLNQTESGSVLPKSPTQEEQPAQVPNMAAADPVESKSSFSAEEPKSALPLPDPLSEKRRRMTQREKMHQQLESVLACLEKGQNVDASCCQSLMPKRAEFEFLLAEIIRNATGQRQVAAVTALGFVGTDGSVPGLLQSASSESLRAAAVKAVKRCSSEQMLAALVLQPGNQALAEEYVRELAHRSTPKAAFAWLHLVRTPESRDLCLRLADELSPALVNILFSELDAPVMDDRMAAILSLGRRGDDQTLKRVTQLCQQFPGRWEPVAVLIWNGSELAMNTLTVMQQAPERYAVLQTASIQLKAFMSQPPGI